MHSRLEPGKLCVRRINGCFVPDPSKKCEDRLMDEIGVGRKHDCLNDV